MRRVAFTWIITDIPAFIGSQRENKTQRQLSEKKSRHQDVSMDCSEEDHGRFTVAIKQGHLSRLYRLFVYPLNKAAYTALLWSVLPTAYRGLAGAVASRCTTYKHPASAPRPH